MGNYAIKFLFVLTVTLSISCASSHKIDENALAFIRTRKPRPKPWSYTSNCKRELRARYYARASRRFGLWQQLVLGRGAPDVKSVCGDYPAVFGWDIGDIEKGNLANCDSIPFTTLANYVRKVEQWGGISVFTWHASNPVTGKPPVIAVHKTRSNRLSKMIRFKKKFLASLDKVAQFLGNLKDEAGEPIPVIFQPFHGHDSDTALWWSTTQCSASDFKNLWKLTVNYLQNEKSVHNLLYAYSVYSNDPADILPAYYPGNDFVDIIGINSHLLQGDGCSGREFIQELNEGIAFVTQFAAKNKK